MKTLKYMFIISIVCINTAFCDENYANDITETPNQMFFSGSGNTLIDSIIVRGIDPIPNDKIDSIILSREGQVLNDGLIEHDVAALTDFFRREGWWKTHVGASVDSLHDGSVILIYRVNKDKPVIFGRLSIHSEEQIPVFFTVSKSELYGKNFTSQILDQTINNIVSQFTANGYPDVVLSPSLSAQDDTVNVVLNIYPGQRAIIDSIAVYGLTRTKDYVVRRELSYLHGQTAGKNAVSTARTSIGRINYLHMMNDPYIAYTDDGKCILVANLNEGKQGSFDGVVGYQPSSGDESGEMVGKIHLVFPNIMGTGRSSRIRWEKMGKDTEDIELLYTEPWVLGFPYNISGSFVQEQREKLDYTKTIIQTSITRAFGRLYSSGGYRYEKVSSDSLNSSSANGIDIGISWDSIDNTENPGSGIRYSVTWSNISKKYRFISKGSHSLERLEFDLDHYVPTLTNQTLAVLVRYRRVDTPSEKLSLSDRYWLGGSTSIRGYREKIFPATKALWATLEYRLIRGRASRVFAFIDTGHLINKTRDSEGHYSKKTINRTGYGFGLRIESRAGTLGFDFGLGRGDSLGDGKLHVSLSSSF